MRKDTRSFRSSLLAAARVLIGDGLVYDGPLVVTVAREEGDERVVRPVSGADGLDAQPATATTPADMARVLFSRDETRILAALIAESPAKASAVLEECKVEKSKFWVLWSNLQQRGVVVDAEEGEGFVIGPDWVREFLARG